MTQPKINLHLVAAELADLVPSLAAEIPENRVAIIESHLLRMRPPSPVVPPGMVSAEVHNERLALWIELCTANECRVRELEWEVASCKLKVASCIRATRNVSLTFNLQPAASK